MSSTYKSTVARQESLEKVASKYNPNATLTLKEVNNSYEDISYVLLKVRDGIGRMLLRIKFVRHPGCCGGINFFSLSMKKGNEELAQEMIDTICEVTKRRCATYITKESQSAIVKFFKDNGWESADMGVNPNSDNRLTMWTYNPNGVKEI